MYFGNGRLIAGLDLVCAGRGPGARRGGGVLPYKGLMGTCGQPGYIFRDFYECKQGIKNRNSVLNRVGKCLKQGQGMRSRAAPPHPRIYRVPPTPPGDEVKRDKPSVLCIQRSYFLLTKMLLKFHIRCD